MSIKTNVVIHNATTKKHEPLAAGDKLAGSVVQLSADAGNSLALGTDGGLKVSIPAALPDDQVLTGDASGSVAVTLTPATQPNGDVNYTIKADTKIDPAVGNSATVTSAGIFVPTTTVPTYTTGNAPTVVDDGTTTTQYFGGNSIALGNPVGWEKRVGTTKVYPVYDEGSVSGGATSVSGKQTEFGIVINDSNNDLVITFTTPFPVGTVPFITLTPRGDGSQVSDFSFDSLSNTGFTLKRGYSLSIGGLQDVEWKAEEK